MTLDEATEVVRFLGAAYPTQRVKMSREDVGGMLAAYTAGLVDLELARVKVAVSNLVKSTKWIPTIAEIREAVVDAEHGKRRSGGEAWGDVVGAIRRYGWSRSPGVDFNFDDPIVSDVVRAFGWHDLCRSENAIADRARFVDSYDAAVKRERTEIAIEQGATAKRLPGAGPTQAGYQPKISPVGVTLELAQRPLAEALAAREIASRLCDGCRQDKPHDEACARRGMVLERGCTWCQVVTRFKLGNEPAKCPLCGADPKPIMKWVCDGKHDEAIPDGADQWTCADLRCHRRNPDETP